MSVERGLMSLLCGMMAGAVARGGEALLKGILGKETGDIIRHTQTV
jgi:hypothetical protein